MRLKKTIDKTYMTFYALYGSKTTSGYVAYVVQKIA